MKKKIAAIHTHYPPRKLKFPVAQIHLRRRLLEKPLPKQIKIFNFANDFLSHK